MNSLELADSPLTAGDDLLPLQLRIAQRADALAPTPRESRDPASDRSCWLAAEAEVFRTLSARQSSPDSAPDAA